MAMDTTGARVVADGIASHPDYDFPPPDAFFAPGVPTGAVVFDVRDFGAVADANVNNQPMIQAAIDAAHNAGGGIIYIPPGTYGIGIHPDGYGGLHVLGNVFLKGAGMGETNLRLMDGTDGPVTGIVRSPWNEGTNNWGVSDLSIDGNKAHTTGKIDGFFTGPQPGSTITDSDVYIQRVEIHDVSRYGFDPHEQTTRLSIKDSVAHDNGVDGFVLDFTSDSEISGNVSYANGRHGFNFVTTSSDVLLKDNVAHDNGGAGFVIQRGSENIEAPHGITLDGGQSYNNGREGVLVQMATDVTIQNMEIDHNGTNGVRILGGAHESLVGNHIHDNSQSANDGFSEVDIAAFVDTVYGKTYAATDNLVQGNTITSNGLVESRYGIEEHGGSTSGNIVLDNTVSGTVRGPYALAGTDSYALKYGTAADDTIQGSATKDHILGGDGNDILYGMDGNDLIEGGNGLDQLIGGKGNDTLHGNAGNDTLDGGTDNDKLYGESGDDKLIGGSGNDRLSGGAGNDNVSGGTGDDVALADAGTDYLDGGAGFDTLDASALTSAVTVDLFAKTMTGLASGTDTVISFEKVIGTAFDDTLRGDNNANTLIGGDGNDTIRGLGGADMLTGGNGADTFVWGAAKDVISSGVHLGLDHITDFGGADRLDVHGLLGTQLFASVNDVVHVTDTAAGALVSVKIAGVFQDVVMLDGQHETSAADMLAAGHLVI